VFAYESRPYRQRVRQLLAENQFELVHVDSLDLSGYLEEFEGLPVVCDHHNVESALLRRRATQETNALRRAYVGFQSGLTRKEEIRWCGQVHLNLTVSLEDERLLRERAPGCANLVVPNGVDTNEFLPDFSGDEGVVFVGGYTWFPNRDGMEYFAEQILPRFKERTPESPIVWVGRASEPVVQHFREQFGIHLTGYVEDIRPYVLSAACFIVPLRVGGGTRLKILDAWAMGKAVVSTSQGCEGLDARNGKNILIRDDPDEFADAVREVLEDPILRIRLGRAGRETAEKKYDWEVVGEAMLATYEGLRTDQRVDHPIHPEPKGSDGAELKDGDS
jgi:glycosyltransferase involved in cell wall biosynthesis